MLSIDIMAFRCGIGGLRRSEMAQLVSDPSRLETQSLKLLPQTWKPEGEFTHFPPMAASWDLTALKQTHCS